jgi:uncharacterized protein YbaR (Trm112 family)
MGLPKTSSWKRRQLDVFIYSTNVHIDRIFGRRDVSNRSIEIDYAKQAGSYNAKSKNKPKSKWCVIDDEPQRGLTSETYRVRLAEMSAILAPLRPTSIFEVGCGEFTSLIPLTKSLGVTDFGGADLSLNRVLAGISYYQDNIRDNTSVFVKANAQKLPLKSCSTDLVFTAHCLELMPPSIRRDAVKEICRISGNHVVFFEPAYENAHWLQRYRNSSLGYLSGMREFIAVSTDFDLIDNFMLHNHANPVNRTEVWILKRTNTKKIHNAMVDSVVCPQCKTELCDSGTAELFCLDCNLVFSTIGDIPVLDIDYAHHVSAEFLGVNDNAHELLDV